MFEARLSQGLVLKKVLEAVRELITEANFEIVGGDHGGIALQAMDSSHVSLVSLHLGARGFEHFRCDRSFSMGMNLNNMAKMLKCAGNDDSITIRAEDNGDTVSFYFENPNNDRVAEFELKLMDIANEHLGIPETEYSATVRMPSAEFQRICKDLSSIGDTVELSVTKDGIQFMTGGDIGNASVVCRPTNVMDGGRDGESETAIDVIEPVALTFALRYLNSFTKASPLSPTVIIKLSKELPVVIEYRIPELGHVRYYLAPKIEDEEEGMDD